MSDAIESIMIACIIAMMIVDACDEGVMSMQKIFARSVIGVVQSFFCFV
jgi:hypothetical protein